MKLSKKKKTKYYLETHICGETIFRNKGVHTIIQISIGRVRGHKKTA